MIPNYIDRMASLNTVENRRAYRATPEKWTFLEEVIGEEFGEERVFTDTFDVGGQTLEEHFDSQDRLLAWLERAIDRLETALSDSKG